MTKPTKNMSTPTRFKTSARAVAVAAALACLPVAANAAGLGRLTVFSGLGQPLRAEIELSANREELSGMTARLAPPEAFRQAGVDYASTLLGLRFVVDKRADGKAVIRLSSERPISDPYVDVLLELNWPSGRLVREYTFLLDPPEVAAKNAPSVSTVEAKLVPAAKAADEPSSDTPPAPAQVAAVVPVASAAAAPAKGKGKSKDRESARKPAASASEPKDSEAKTAVDAAKTVATRPVKAGDNLRKIADETRPEGVSLEQMLVGLFRANQDAFIGGNMNRLRTGAIIGVPDQESLAAIPQEQAKKTFVAQSQDWNNYRRKLAAAAADAPARDDAGAQSATGRVTAKVEDKAKPASEAKDQVKVAKSEPGKAAKGALEEDLIAKDKALNEANQRLATLEKNVAELQKLLAMKSQNLAELQKAAKPEEKKPETAKPEAKPDVKPDVKPESKPETKAESKPDVPAAVPAAAADAAKPVEPPEAAKPVAPAKPVMPPPPPPAPVPEPSFIDTLLGDPLPVAGLGAVAAMLLGLLFMRRRRASATAEEGDVPALVVPSMPKQESQPATADGEATKAPLTDFSQAGPGTIDTGEVDLVAEADVYIAYGRDAQAEEILLEAQQKDPTRVAIPAKLLEIYAKRQDNASYEAVARVLQSLTGGVGPEWEKATQQGSQIDPANPLYAEAATTAVAAEPAPDFDADATLIDTPAEAPVDDLVSLDFDLPAAAVAEEVAPAAAEADFSLPEAPAVADQPAEEGNVLDFDLDAALPVAEEVAASSALDDGNALDFDFELPSADALAAREEAAIAAPAEAPVDADNIMDFDLSASALPVADELPADSPAEAAVDNSVSLDFELPDLTLPVAQPPAADDSLEAFDFDLPEGTAALDSAEPAYVAAAPEELPEAIDLPELTVEAPADVPADVSADEVPSLPPFDLSAINLDLDTPEPVAESPTDTVVDMAPAEELVAAELAEPLMVEVEEALVPEVEPPVAEVSDEIDLDALALPSFSETAESPAEVADLPVADEVDNPDVETKLDLAKAYEEMGDQEGARELLEEVLSEGSAKQQQAARTLLAKLG